MIHVLALIIQCIWDFFKHVTCPLPLCSTCVFSKNSYIRENIMFHLRMHPFLNTMRPVLQTLLSFSMSFFKPKGIRWNYESVLHKNTLLHFWHYSPFAADSIETPIIVCVPGINGHNQSHYVNQLVEFCRSQGIVCVVIDKQEIDMNSTWELEVLVDLLTSHHLKIMILGVSAGGNTVCRFAASKNIPHNVKVCVSLSNGLDIAHVKESIKYPWAHVTMPLYKSYMIRKSCIPRKAFRAVKTIWDVNDVVYDYPDMSYYNKCSSHTALQNTRVPLVIISALDDPFFDSSVLSHVHKAIEKNDMITLITTDYGGHMGWIQHGRSWIFDEVVKVISHVYEFSYTQASQ